LIEYLRASPSGKWTSFVRALGGRDGSVDLAWTARGDACEQLVVERRPYLHPAACRLGGTVDRDSNVGNDQMLGAGAGSN